MQYLKEEVRSKICSAAVEEFKTFGYQDASVRRIADNAGISLGNIYRYFENKEALHLAVIKPLMERVTVFGEEDYFADGSDLKLTASKLVDFMTENDDLIVILRKGNTAYYKQFSNYLEEMTMQKIDMLFPPAQLDKIQNPDLIKIIARSFLHCLFDVIAGTKSKSQRKAYVEEILSFYFSHLESRFAL